jgi:hypothetical protein
VDIHAKYPGTGGTQDGLGNVVFDPLVHFNRPSLLLFNNLVYTGWSSHEDNGEYQGWMIAYNKTTLAQAGVFNTSPNNPPGVGGGSIWQSSIGLVSDADSVYIVTGNGPYDANTGGPNFGDSAIRLSTSFKVLDYFTPCNQQELNTLDVDLGSSGFMILPDQTAAHVKIATHAGKEGSIYVLDRTNMGKYQATTVANNVPCSDNVLQKLWRVLGSTPTTGDSSREAFWGAPAYYRDSLGHQFVYYSGAESPIKAYSLASDTLAPTTQTADAYPNGGSIPTISSNGGAAGTAILWAIKRANSAEGNGPLTLDAYDATNLASRLLVDLPAGQWSERNYAFLIPTVANGKVYIASDKEVDVFGLKAGPTTPIGPLTISPSMLNFKVKVGKSSKAKFVKIKNPKNNSGDATILSFETGNKAAFKVSVATTTCRRSLPIGKTCKIGVTFTPISVGTQADTLDITNNADNSPQHVPLSGIGK